ncbi:MAG: late competence development ComFB family protein [Acidobacteria bacterium]|nr:late competence development ComFB family protein [Acidobacteriota bacterium]
MEPLRYRSHGDEQDEGGVESSVREMRQVLGVSLDRIRNAGEVLVCRMLERKLEACIEVCRCQQCLEDMYCLALNRVPSLYYHSASSFARQMDVNGPPNDIFDALDRALDFAIIRVGENPSHSR